MHLTRVLNWFIRYTKVPGNLYTGKNKIIPKIRVNHKERALKRFLLQEENFKVLDRPYLTTAEDNGHMEALGFTEEAQNKQKLLENNHERWTKPMNRRIHYLEEHLKHLNVQKSWE